MGKELLSCYYNDTKSYQKSNRMLSMLHLQMVDICCTQQIYCDQSWTQNLIITNPHVSIIYHITIMGQMFLWFISLCLNTELPVILLQIHRKYWRPMTQRLDVIFQSWNRQCLGLSIDLWGRTQIMWPANSNCLLMLLYTKRESKSRH